MLKIKMVKLKGKAYLLSITENNKTIYFNDGYISTREELNNIYKANFAYWYNKGREIDSLPFIFYTWQISVDMII